jgi:Leucine-rich repeat (LRR) protein
MNQDENISFYDEFLLQVTKNMNPSELEVFRFDFSPLKRAKIFRVSPLIKFKNITELSLIGHDIQNIENIKSMSSLRNINLSFNSISSMTPLFSLKYLEILMLNHNRIEFIPSEIKSLKKLKTLHIGSNFLNDRRDFVRLEPLKNLISLNIEGTPLSRLPDSLYFAVFTLPQLIILNFQNISIEFRRQASERYECLQIEKLNEANLNLKNLMRNFK